MKIKILTRFEHNERVYFIFSLENSPKEYIFFTHCQLPIRSLLFGRDFHLRWKNFDNTSSECFECSLAKEIEGGVSYDHDDQVEFSFSIDNANQILTELQKAVDITDQKKLKFF
ncbi:MAG: hypothetical protein ACTSYI_01610 [Promethearchaeota archaeon]